MHFCRIDDLRVPCRQLCMTCVQFCRRSRAGVSIRQLCILRMSERQLDRALSRPDVAGS
jgi:hypothetical protein